MPNTRRPAAVVVSICVPSPASTRRSTPLADRSCTVLTRWARSGPASPATRGRPGNGPPGSSLVSGGPPVIEAGRQVRRFGAADLAAGRWSTAADRHQHAVVGGPPRRSGNYPRVRGRTPGLPRGASACDGGSRARPGGAIAAPGRGRREVVLDEGGRRRGDGRDATAVASPPGAVSARRPSASASAQQQQRKRERADHRQSRHRRQVRDDRELHGRRARVARCRS